MAAVLTFRPRPLQVGRTLGVAERSTSVSRASVASCRHNLFATHASEPSATVSPLPCIGCVCDVAKAVKVMTRVCAMRRGSQRAQRCLSEMVHAGAGHHLGRALRPFHESQLHRSSARERRSCTIRGNLIPVSARDFAVCVVVVLVCWCAYSYVRAHSGVGGSGFGMRIRGRHGVGGNPL